MGCRGGRWQLLGCLGRSRCLALLTLGGLELLSPVVNGNINYGRVDFLPHFAEGNDRKTGE